MMRIVEVGYTNSDPYLDKLVDEIAKGKEMEKVLRTPWK